METATRAICADRACTNENHGHSWMRKQPKTLADFKRDIVVSQTIELVRYQEKRFNSVTQRYDGQFYNDTIPEKMRGVRYVSYKDTTGFYLKRTDDKSQRGSFCGYPKASQLEYDGDTFTITEVDRHGTAYEKRTYKLINYK